jgi:hypothetical protein
MERRRGRVRRPAAPQRPHRRPGHPEHSLETVRARQPEQRRNSPVEPGPLCRRALPGQRAALDALSVQHPLSGAAYRQGLRLVRSVAGVAGRTEHVRLRPHPWPTARRGGAGRSGLSGGAIPDHQRRRLPDDRRRRRLATVAAGLHRPRYYHQPRPAGAPPPHAAMGRHRRGRPGTASPGRARRVHLLHIARDGAVCAMASRCGTANYELRTTNYE